MNPLDWIRALGALAITLGLLIGVALLAKRYGLMQGVSPLASKGRLRIIEQLWLDAGKTRAVILQCDGVDHLIIVSPSATQNIATTHAITSAKVPNDESQS